MRLGNALQTAACRGPQGAGQLQSSNQATYAPLGRTQHGAGGGEIEALPVGLEGELRVSANTPSLAKAGRVTTPPTAGHPVQALETA